MKKGFTLIELLAVILILGIIALIAIPQVTNVIGRANKGAAEVSAEHYVSAVNSQTALNKLDTDSSNDITDGYKKIDNIQVNISGTTPTEGYTIIENGNIVFAELEVNKNTVLCNKNGKCTTNLVYYSKSSTSTNIKLSDTTKERPTTTRTYLRYPVFNNELGNPQACVYENEKEFCLDNNDSEISKQRILEYYGFDESWDYSNNFYHNPDYTIACQKNPMIQCSRSDLNMIADSSGSVVVTDFNTTGLQCILRNTGKASCM